MRYNITWNTVECARRIWPILIEKPLQTNKYLKISENSSKIEKSQNMRNQIFKFEPQNESYSAIFLKTS